MSADSPENRPPPSNEKSLDDLFALDEKAPGKEAALTERDVPKAAEKRVEDIEDELAMLDTEGADGDVSGLIGGDAEPPSDEPDLGVLDGEPPEDGTDIFAEEPDAPEEKGKQRAPIKPRESLFGSVERFAEEQSTDLTSTRDRAKDRLLAEEEKTGLPVSKERELQVQEEEFNKSRRQLAENSRDDIKDAVRPPFRKGRTETKEQKRKREKLESRIDTVLSDEQGPDGASQFEKHLNDVLRIEAIEDEDKREQARARYLAALLADLLRDLPEDRQIIVIGENDPKPDGRWLGRDGAVRVAERLAGLIDRLLTLQPTEGEYGPMPVDVTFTEDGKAEWVSFYDAHNAELDDLHGPLRSAYSKLEAYCAHLALVLALVRDPDTYSVDAEAVRAAVRLVGWFGHEARRVYALLLPSVDDDPATRNRAKLMDFIQRKGGKVTVRDVRRGCWWLRDGDAAEMTLRELVKSGLCVVDTVRSGSRGGRPKEVFRLPSTQRRIDETPVFPGKDEVSSSVETVEKEKTDPDWRREIRRGRIRR